MLLRKTEDKNVLASAAELATKEAPVRMYASLCVIQAQDTGRVLVTHRAKDGQLGLPCGKADEGESERETAYRELEEETGVRFKDLADGLSYIQTINFKGAVISVYHSTVKTELAVAPTSGFEVEGPAAWMSVEEILNTKSLFQDFNTVVLFNAGLV